MKSKRKNRALGGILDDYNDLLNDYKLSQTDETKEKINTLQDEAKNSIEQNKKNIKGLILFFFFLLTLFIFTAIYILIIEKDNSNLSIDNIEKTNIINKLQWSDSLFNQIMNVKYDSIGNRTVSYFRNNKGEIITYDELNLKNDSLKNQIHNLQWSNKIFDKIMPAHTDPQNRFKEVSYLTINGKILTYGELGDMYNELQKENNKLKTDISDLLWSDSVLNKIIFIEIDSINKAKKTSLYLKNGEVVKYNELIVELDELHKKVFLLESKINLIQKKYDIAFEETDKNISISALRVDSALLLLPYYRDKLEYDSNGQFWNITLPRK